MNVRAWVVCLVLLLLAGCGDDTVLFGGLTEQDANDVIATLADEHIVAHKQAQKTGVTVLVAATDINRAVRVLNAAGLPHQTVTSSKKKG